MPNTIIPPVIQTHAIRFGEQNRDALEVAAVELIVIVAVTGLAFVMLMGDEIVQPGRFWAPAGEEVIAQESVTAPVKPPAGEIVTVDEFPVVAPGVRMVRGVPLRAKGTVTLTESGVSDGV